LSIEHIYPENPKANVWKPLEEKLIGNFANLVLLDTGLNSKVGNIDYLKKKEIILKESKIISTKEVFEKFDNWSEEEILKRKEYLIEYIFNDIWN